MNSERAVHRVLVAPYGTVPPGALFAITLGAVGLGLAASRLGLRFDGFLNVRSDIPGPTALSLALADQFACVVVPAAFAWVLARGFRSPVRIEWLLLTIGLIRLPLALAAPAAWAMDTPDPTFTEVTLAAIVGSGAWAWAVLLLVNGLRHATDLTHWRLATVAVCTIISAEVATMFVLSRLV